MYKCISNCGNYVKLLFTTESCKMYQFYGGVIVKSEVWFAIILIQAFQLDPRRT